MTSEQRREVQTHLECGLYDPIKRSIPQKRNNVDILTQLKIVKDIYVHTIPVY